MREARKGDRALVLLPAKPSPFDAAISGEVVDVLSDPQRKPQPMPGAIVSIEPGPFNECEAPPKLRALLAATITEAGSSIASYRVLVPTRYLLVIDDPDASNLETVASSGKTILNQPA